MQLRPRRVANVLAPLVGVLIFVSCGSSDGHADAAAEAEKAILSTFEQINRIPRCSKDEARISAWLIEWARTRRFPASADAHRNVLITVPASAGHEDRPAVVLQAHMDMVCVKTETSSHDFTKDPIPVIRDGDWIRAQDTTLGADDGIGIAIALTLAERSTRPRPKLEILITADEEKDMSGAAGLSPTLLTGTRYINLDSENDSVITLGAAGGMHTEIDLPLAMTPLPADMSVHVLRVSGLAGGHSGIDIDKNRANANVLLADLLSEGMPFRLVEFSGGSVGNAIATTAQATLAVAPGDKAALEKRAADFAEDARSRFPGESGMAISLGQATNRPNTAATPESSATAARLIATIPQGVTAWSAEFPHLPETSNNIGIVSTQGSSLKVSTFQRSFHADRLADIAGQIAATAQAAGGSSTQRGAFPAWPPESATGLYRSVTDAHARLFGSPMATEVIHAGLECGYIADKYPAMEIISIGPTLENVHTTNERLNIASLRKMWTLLEDVLEAQ